MHTLQAYENDQVLVVVVVVGLALVDLFMDGRIAFAFSVVLLGHLQLFDIWVFFSWCFF